MRADVDLMRWAAAAVTAIGLAVLAFAIADASMDLGAYRADPLARAAARSAARPGEESSSPDGSDELGLAALLGHRPVETRPVAAVSPRPPDASVESALVPESTTPKPVVADWISYIGNATGEDGAKSYFFKDSREGKVIKIAIGGTSGAWKLLSFDAGVFSLELAGQVYLVNGAGK